MATTIVREARRKVAEERNAKWAALTPKEQLASLDRRNLRALKQRAQIQAKLAAQAPVEKPETSTEIDTPKAKVKIKKVKG